jgi:DNA-binding transcriptional MerR regulator
MPPKLIKAADVCKLAEVQPYVLRSWEKEFPGIGIDGSAEGGRLYRPVDVEQVRRIRQLVFGEGLTVAGARRRLEAAGEAPAVSEAEAVEVLEAALGADARKRLVLVREGLASILAMLGGAPGDAEFRLRPAEARAQASAAAAKHKTGGRGRTAAKAPARASASGKGSGASKRKRASA